MAPADQACPLSLQPAVIPPCASITLASALAAIMSTPPEPSPGPVAAAPASDACGAAPCAVEEGLEQDDTRLLNPDDWHLGGSCTILLPGHGPSEMPSWLLARGAWRF